MSERVQKVQVEYHQAIAPGYIELTFRTPDGSRLTHTMAPSDVVTLSLTDSAFIDPKAEKPAEKPAPAPKKGQRELAYAKAEELLAATGDPSDILALAQWLVDDIVASEPF